MSTLCSACGSRFIILRLVLLQKILWRESEAAMLVRNLVLTINLLLCFKLSVRIHSFFLAFTPLNTRPGNYFKILCSSQIKTEQF